MIYPAQLPKCCLNNFFFNFLHFFERLFLFVSPLDARYLIKCFLSYCRLYGILCCEVFLVTIDFLLCIRRMINTRLQKYLPLHPRLIKCCRFVIKRDMATSQWAKSPKKQSVGMPTAVD